MLREMKVENTVSEEGPFSTSTRGVGGEGLALEQGVGGAASFIELSVAPPVGEVRRGTRTQLEVAHNWTSRARARTELTVKHSRAV